MSNTRCGFIALSGRPNVGKSTLLNALLGTKVSIVTPRPQTTRQRITGVLTRDDAQYVFVDTPGLHGGGRRRLNRLMDQAARHALADADVALVLVPADRMNDDDHRIIDAARDSGHPVVVAVNRIDRLQAKHELLPLMAKLSERHPEVADVVPVSALRRDNLDTLLQVLHGHLPASVFLYPVDALTDQSEAVRVTETVREKLMLHLREELPYGIAVGLDKFSRDDGGVNVQAVVWVEQERHKGIVIGRGGSMLKDIGTAARLSLRRMLGEPVHLELWVRVRRDWADDERALEEFGYRQ